MLAVRDGDAAALDRLFARHHRRLYGFLVRMTGDRHAAEDLVQEAFLRLLRHRETYQPSGRFEAWLFRIGRNLAHDHHRGRHATIPLDDAGELEPVEPDAPRLLEGDDARRALEQAMASLPIQHREVLLLRGVEGLTNEEIASVLGCSDGAARVRIHRATAALRNLIRWPVEEPS